MITWKRLRTCAAVCVIIFASGCGGPGLCTVTGKITSKSKPVCTGAINLLAENGEYFSGGIDQEGNYTLINVPTGTFKVAVISDKPAGPPPMSIKRNPNDPPPPAPAVVANWVPVDAKYGDPNTSGKQITLNSGTNTVNIDLE